MKCRTNIKPSFRAWYLRQEGSNITAREIHSDHWRYTSSGGLSRFQPSVILHTGFYAGYVASAFTLGRFLSGYAWGHVSDSIGRKPVIIVALSATSVLSLTFGLSTNYQLAISSRWVFVTSGRGTRSTEKIYAAANHPGCKAFHRSIDQNWLPHAAGVLGPIAPHPTLLGSQVAH